MKKFEEIVESLKEPMKEAGVPFFFLFNMGDTWANWANGVTDIEIVGVLEIIKQRIIRKRCLHLEGFDTADKIEDRKEP